MIIDFDKYILFEFYQPLKFHQIVTFHPNSRYYTFSTDKWDYRVSIEMTDRDFPWFGFKAKTKGSRDFNYDVDVITNDNIYLVMSTISDILKYDFRNNPGMKGFNFSTYRNKKGFQRERIYLNLLSKSDWTFERDEEYDNYIYIKPNSGGQFTKNHGGNNYQNHGGNGNN